MRDSSLTRIVSSSMQLFSLHTSITHSAKSIETLLTVSVNVTMVRLSSSTLTGVHTRILEDNPNAIYIHCHATS